MISKISISDILREGFEAAKKNANSVFPLFVGIEALIFLLQYFLNMSVLNLLMIPVVLLMQVAIFKSFKNPYTKFEINEILSLNDKNLKPTLWKLFISYLIYIILLIVLFALLFVPGVIFAVYWYVFSYIVIDQNLSGMEALKKSKQMITGNWWKTFAIVIISVILTAIASGIVSAISAENAFISGLLMSIVSAVISIYFGYVAVAYYFSLKK